MIRQHKCCMCNSEVNRIRIYLYIYVFLKPRYHFSSDIKKRNFSIFVLSNILINNRQCSLLATQYLTELQKIPEKSNTYRNSYSYSSSASFNIGTHLPLILTKPCLHGVTKIFLRTPLLLDFTPKIF